VEVFDNEPVKAGQFLVRLRAEDFQAQVLVSARAELEQTIGRTPGQ
jgi:multidrug resistance efflux pump